MIAACATPAASGSASSPLVRTPTVGQPLARAKRSCAEPCSTATRTPTCPGSRPGEPQRNRTEIGLGENHPGPALRRIEQADRRHVVIAGCQLVEHIVDGGHLVVALDAHFFAHGADDADTEAAQLAGGIAKGHRRRVVENGDAQRTLASRHRVADSNDQQHQNGESATPQRQHDLSPSAHLLLKYKHSD
jgi:hypothetical protein